MIDKTLLDAARALKSNPIRMRSAALVTRLEIVKAVITIEKFETEATLGKIAGAWLYESNGAAAMLRAVEGYDFAEEHGSFDREWAESILKKHEAVISTVTAHG
jgi:hypothetical protein